MNEETMQKVLQAMELVKSGTVKRVDVTDDIKVYVTTNTIRVDIKCDGLR